MLYYAITLKCPHCLCQCPAELIAEVEPPPDVVFRIICPTHGGSISVAFRYFKPTEPFPPTESTLCYPPQPPRHQIHSLHSRSRRWWQFWKTGGGSTDEP